jgi:hypothetical protein
MPYLKIYEWENGAYPEFLPIKVKREDAPKYFKKFARHFRVIRPTLDFWRVKRHVGTYYHYTKSIALPKIASLGLIVHEFAHHLADEQNGKRNMHNKVFKRALKRTYTFAKRYLTLTSAS